MIHLRMMIGYFLCFRCFMTLLYSFILNNNILNIYYNLFIILGFWGFGDIKSKLLGMHQMNRKEINNSA